MFILIVVLLPWPGTPAILAAETSPPSGPAILITEIQTEGATTSDEFIELYNFGTAPINLKSWRLTKKTASGTESNLLTDFPEITLNPLNFLLIANQNYASTINSELKFSTQTTIADNNTLTLYSDAGKTIVDLVGWGTTSVFAGKPAGNADKGFTLQRIYNGQNFLNTHDNATDFTVASPTAHNLTIIAPATNPSAATPETINESPPPNTGGSYFTPDTLKKMNELKVPRVFFNEIFPTPTADQENNEFIELKSFDERMIDLTFWQIKTSAGLFTFEPEKFVQPYLYTGQVFLLKRSDSHLALSDSGDTIKLIMPDGKTLEQLKYEAAISNASYMKDTVNSRWRWSAKTTPGSENLYAAANHPPVAALQVRFDGHKVTLDGSDSFDIDGDPIQYNWKIKNGDDIATKNGKIVILEKTTAGTYDIVLKVSEASGQFDITNKKWRLNEDEITNELPGTVNASALSRSDGAVGNPIKTSLQKTAISPKTSNFTKKAAPTGRMAEATAAKKSKSPLKLVIIYSVLATIMAIAWKLQKKRPLSKVTATLATPVKPS